MYILPEVFKMNNMYYAQDVLASDTFPTNTMDTKSKPFCLLILSQISNFNTTICSIIIN